VEISGEDREREIEREISRWSSFAKVLLTVDREAFDAVMDSYRRLASESADAAGLSQDVFRGKNSKVVLQQLWNALFRSNSTPKSESRPRIVGNQILKSHSASSVFQPSMRHGDEKLDSGTNNHKRSAKKRRRKQRQNR